MNAIPPIIRGALCGAIIGGSITFLHNINSGKPRNSQISEGLNTAVIGLIYGVALDAIATYGDRIVTFSATLWLLIGIGEAYNFSPRQKLQHWIPITLLSITFGATLGFAASKI